MYTAGNPVMLVDPDGREIGGFSINDKGEVEVNREKASKKSIAVYEEMKKTDTGNKQFKNMVESETKIRLKLTDKKLYDSNGNMIHGETYGTGTSDNGNYKKATIYISTAKTGDRFDNATKGEMINAIGVHESIHAIDAAQIAKDRNEPASWATERKPIEMEYISRTEYNNGDNSKFKKSYEDTDPQAIDPYGNPKPPFYFPLEKYNDMKTATLFIFFFVLIIFFVSCNSLKLSTDVTKYDINKENGYFLSHSDSTGLTTYSHNKNGLKQGREIVFNSNGTIASINKYQKGLKHGWCITYLNGNSSSEIKYKYGKAKKVRMINTSW